MLFAFVFATVGAGLWAVITDLTHFEIGIVAVVVGILAGSGASKGGRGTAAQVIGATAGAFGYFLGEVLIGVFALLGSEPATKVRDAAAHHHSSAWMLHHHPVISMGLIAFLVIKHTFTSLGVVFLGICVYEG